MENEFIILLKNFESFKKLDFINKNKIPKTSGIYLLCDKKGVCYVGSSFNLYNRLLSHQVFRLKDITHIYYKEIEDYEDMTTQEKLYMYYFLRRFNNISTIGKVEIYPKKDITKEELDHLGKELIKIDFG